MIPIQTTEPVSHEAFVEVAAKKLVGLVFVDLQRDEFKGELVAVWAFGRTMEGHPDVALAFGTGTSVDLGSEVSGREEWLALRKSFQGVRVKSVVSSFVRIKEGDVQALVVSLEDGRDMKFAGPGVMLMAIE